MARDEVVSDDGEKLILVDAHDREIGSETKSECHRGSGLLHRAFSIFVFNGDDELLLQKRAASKRLWPDFWSNTCCSHPRFGESMEEATLRRLEQELGFECPLEFLYKFKYRAQYDPTGAEHEYCWVYYGRHDGPIDVNVSEVGDWRYVSIEDLESELEAAPQRFTPWFKMEWEHIRSNFLEALLTRTGTDG